VNFLRELDFKQNTIAKSITHLLTITRHAKKKGLHDNDVDYSIQKEKTQHIRLTPEEVQRIVDLNISDWPELKDEWERFQVAYNLILRFGDTIAINEKNIIKRGDKYFLSAFTGKTKKEILLPLKNIVYQILKRNKFKLKASNSKSNQKLKKLGLLAGINDKVTLTEFRGGKKSEIVYRKYQKIKTHTTRRSAARNLFDSGMPPEIIMTLGGWSNMKQLLDYIDIDLDYAASKAAEHPFFH
jgi:site-specific recombinase XerD